MLSGCPACARQDDDFDVRDPEGVRSLSVEEVTRAVAAGLRAGAASVVLPASCSRCQAVLVLEVVRPTSGEAAEEAARVHVAT